MVFVEIVLQVAWRSRRGFFMLVIPSQLLLLSMDVFGCGLDGREYGFMTDRVSEKSTSIESVSPPFALVPDFRT